jgi:LmbE family N-acetylglucosaminyl deacetylase
LRGGDALEAVLRGRIVLVAPHMDDELIGCGGILASLPAPERVFVVYATDGSGSPAPPFPWQGVDRAALARARHQEARAGLEALGVPGENARFLDLPDGRLRRVGSRLREALAGTLEVLAPDTLLLPFRFDGHPDHLAVHRAGRAVAGSGRSGVESPRVLEYFVYARWRLLPEGDVRRLLRPECLHTCEPGPEARARKRRALELHRTQSTRWFAWQARPNLTPEFIERVCSESEVLLDPFDCPGGVFHGSILPLRLVHAVEPPLKRTKDRILAAARGFMK